jgi:hypothetical protein|tara:strand:+ start:96 stop:659 length:564 start_codon:yes stop_codon:yes gene_type:complete
MAKKNKPVSVLDIVQGISQAAANAYDGALNKDGEALKAGLQREEGNPLLDKRVIDGFNVVFYGPMMCIKYHSEVQLKEVYAAGFEADMEQQIADIASFLKKEYRKITGNSVTLTKEGEAEMRVESTSRVRSWVTAKCHYRIGGMDDVIVVGEGSEDTLEKSWRSFLDQGGLGGKRPRNDTRPKPKND